ncbi:MAG: BrnA antitoxin family protein [Pseudomonadota bacterium]
MKSASSRSAKLPNANRKSTLTESKTDWASLKADDPTTNAEHLEASLDHIVQGIVRRGLRPLPPKTSISLRVDQDVLEWFKAQGAGYQTRINTVLRAFRDASV